MSSWTRFALLVAGMLAVAVPLHAQTVANGPYYAMPAWDQTLPAATPFQSAIVGGGVYQVSRSSCR